MRKLALFIMVIVLAGLVVGFYPHFVEKPVKDGSGPLAVYNSPRYPAPEYHSPLEDWQISHTDIVNRGDIAQDDCLYCHEAERSCNNCHDYVGAQRIESQTVAADEVSSAAGSQP